MGKINLVTFVLSCFLDCCFRQSTLHLEMNNIFLTCNSSVEKHTNCFVDNIYQREIH